MDCAGLSDRLAAYLDGQLGSAEMELLEAHLECCPDCVSLTDAMAGQEFGPLTDQERSDICGAADFWGAMDCALNPALENLAPSCVPRMRWTHQRITLPIPMVLAYAAAFGLAVVWGTRHMVRANAAVDSMETIERELDQERRLAAEPKAAPRPQPYRLVNHTPQRDTF